MEEKQKKEIGLHEELLNIDLVMIYKQLKKSWKRICVWCFISVAIGIGIAFSIPKKYTVTAELAPELGTNMSKLSSLTSMLGVSNLGDGSDALYPTLYPEMTQSTPFMVNLLSSEVLLEEDGHSQPMSLRTYLTEHTRRPWWGMAAHWVIDLLKKDGGVPRDTIDPFQLTEGEDALIRSLKKMVDVSVDKKTMSITISTKAQNAHVAADMCITVTALLRQCVTDYRTNKAKEDLAYYQTLYQEVKAEYYQAQSNYAHYVDSHQGIILLSVKAEQERLQNEKNLKYQLYNSIAGELQRAKAKVQQETPVFAEVVPPTIPLKASHPQKKIIAALFLFLGICGGAADVLFWHKKKDDEATSEA